MMGGFVFDYPIMFIVCGASQGDDGRIRRQGTLCVPIDGKQSVVAFTDHDLLERFVEDGGGGRVQVLTIRTAEAFAKFLEAEQRHGAEQIAFDPPRNGKIAKFVMPIIEAIQCASRTQEPPSENCG